MIQAISPWATGHRHRPVRRLRRRGGGARGRPGSGFRPASMTAPRRPSGLPIGPPITRFARRAASTGRRTDCAGRRAAVSGSRPSSSAFSWAGASPRSRRRPKSLTWPPLTAHTTSSITARAICAKRCGRPCPTVRTRSSTRSAANCPNRHCGRCAAAADSSPSATPRASSRHPLNLVLVKGVVILGFQFQDVAPAEFQRNEDELRSSW